MERLRVTTHSKIRYSQRIGYRDELQEELALAKKYGLKRKDISKNDFKKRKYMLNKIYYNKNFYVFSDQTYKTLVTTYPCKKSGYQELFLNKKDKRISIIRKNKRTKYRQTFATINNKNCSFVLDGKKIVELKFVKNIKYKYERYGKNEELAPVFSSIAKYLKGEIIKPRGDVSIDSYPKEEKIVYKEILKLSYGNTITYSALLKKINLAYDVNFTIQKLTGIIKRCPILFLVPSHRVVRKDGKCGSYVGGKELKNKLLKIEKENKNKISTSEKYKYKNRFTSPINNLIS